MKTVLFKIIGVFILGIFGGIFADQILWPYFVERPLFYQYRLNASPVYIKEVIVKENDALTNAIENVGKTVVRIKTQIKQGKYLEGSGLIVTSDGLIVTLADLLPAKTTSTVSFEEKPLSFQVLKRDTANNLVLIEVTDKKNLPTTGFADINKLKLGERVFLVGAVPQKRVDEGIISSFDTDFIKTNIAGETGLQGSVLFDIGGNVIGLGINKDGKISVIPVSKIKEFIGF